MSKIRGNKIVLPTKWTESQLKEIYWRIKNYGFILSKEENQQNDFIDVFYKGIDTEKHYFVLDNAIEKQVIDLCIILRIVGWETTNEIPWINIEKVFRFSQDSITLNNIFVSLQQTTICPIVKQADMSVLWNEPMKCADFVFERLDMLASPIQNRGYLCPQENRLPILSTKYYEEQLSLIYYKLKESGLIKDADGGMYDFVHMFNRATCKTERIVKQKWDGTVKQLAYLMVKIISHDTRKIPWETICQYFTAKNETSINKDSIRVESGRLADYSDNIIDDIFQTIKIKTDDYE